MWLVPRPLTPATAIRNRSLAPITRPEARVPISSSEAPVAAVPCRKRRRLVRGIVVPSRKKEPSKWCAAADPPPKILAEVGGRVVLAAPFRRAWAGWLGVVGGWGRA